MGFADVIDSGFCWALMAPALRSSRRRCPFERRGASFEREVHGVIRSNVSDARKFEGEGSAELLVL